MSDRYQGFLFSPADLAEDVDLDVERRKNILFADAHLTGTHWEVLGIPWNAPAAAAKGAYLEKVKVFHPDRYPGKRLGSFRGRLERIFRRVTEARDVLSDDGRRADERRARLTRSSTTLQRVAPVGELVERGKKALAEGRFPQAANDLLAAQALDPRNAEVAALAAEAKRRATLGKVSDLLRRASEEESRGKLAAAVELYREAVAADPSSVRAAAEAARATAEAGDAAGARALAEGALRTGPRSGIAHEALGHVLEAEGNKKEARRVFERAIELDPSLERARHRLRKLKWGILG